MTFIHLKWEDIQRLCEIVAEKMVKAKYHPDLIVAISRGGFPPARILCDLLEVKRLVSMGIEYYTSVEETKREPTITHRLNADVTDKIVLIVDDIVDTGDSLILAMNHVMERGARDVKTATLHYKPWSVIEPNFYAETTNEWAVYAWEIKETIKQMMLKLKNEGKDRKEIKKRLLDLGFKVKDVERVLINPKS